MISQIFVRVRVPLEEHIDEYRGRLVDASRKMTSNRSGQTLSVCRRQYAEEPDQKEVIVGVHVGPNSQPTVATSRHGGIGLRIIGNRPQK